MKPLKNKLRRWRMARAGVDVNIEAPLVEVGRDQGSWTLAPEGLGPDSVVYSVGVGNDISFDLDLIDRFGVTVHAFDPTPGSADWVAAQSLPDRFAFHPTGLAAFDGDLDFHLPRKPGSVHYTPVRRHRGGDTDTVKAPVRRLHTLMRELGHDHIDLLKIDIEGGEYDVIQDLATHPVQVRQLLVEFHHNYPAIPFRRTVEAVEHLRALGFRILHISPRTYEISFRREEV